MKRSTDRIITSHAGSLPRSNDLRELVVAKESHQPYDASKLAQRLRESVAEVVKKQIESGLDVINDGELSKVTFTSYMRERLSGIEDRKATHPTQKIYARDEKDFPEYFAKGPVFGGGAGGPSGGQGGGTREAVLTGPIKYTGQAAVAADIANFKAALQGVNAMEAFLPAVTPGTIEHWLHNEHYPDAQSYLYAIADALHEEYQAIIDAGFVLQIDDPDLPDAWQIYTQMDIPAYRKFAELRIDALNRALEGLPEDRIRFHTCWGSYHGPHKYDVPLKEIVDLILKVKAECISIEASNPCHEHDYHVWEKVKLPAGKSLMPGVVGHYSDFIEHPELIAERLVRYAKIVGRENVIAGTDCGIGSRVGHAKIAWAKFEAMTEGARIASRQLWNR